MPHLTFAHLASILGFLLALLLMASEVRQRRPASVTFAWLLLIVLVPYAGVPLYLMLGGRKIRRRAAQKKPLYEVTPVTPSNESQIEKLLTGMGVPPKTNDNRVSIIASGEDAFTKMLALIASAKRTIHIATFVLGGDEVGNTILDRLTERAREGVEVRLLVDGVFAYRVDRKRVSELEKAGGRLAFFTPILHVPFMGGRSNLRLHRKIALADGTRAIAGGMNLAEEYMGPRPLKGRWRDVALAIEGSAVADFEEIFRADWEFAANEKIAEAPQKQADSVTSELADGEAPVRVVASGPDVATDTLYDAILFATFSANDRIWIATPYFVPDAALARALTLAVRRGVDVKIIVPDPSNHFTADLAGASDLRDLERSGAKVFPYRRGMLHAKMLLVDRSLSMVGSANFDMRSLFLNYEIVAMLFGEKAIDAVAGWFENLLPECADRMHSAGRIRAAVEDIGRLIGPLE